jgi:hypothetical protein
MRDEYDFSKAVRHNPYAEKMKKGYTVMVHYDFTDGDDNTNETVPKTDEEAKKQA